ncbi:Gfo/Idh/MocA family oxidoreductase [Paenibacillus oenotherae]|uniref:Gfo/Idh/MocA family oxidoreductase n=1 Tax=Paenibacillus oenotherae TaxID=1435645 RepID=A0ABS7DA82_9BACL|nr:Gfo/Idh/MocA family oxidoreductase [Paenibacillus oenotherae]MBW7476496.1 Gfo/Idh/MocA family oxidoreductase [Paenibacillus oenotherae]
MEQGLKLGIIGFGRIVELVHLPIIKKLEQITHYGVYDMTPERVELANRRSIAVYASIDELLASDVDIVLIATPPSSHYELARAALTAGKHVLIEKPVTVTFSEAEGLRRLAQQTGKAVSVFHNRRYDADFCFVKEAIAAGMVGNVLFVERRHHMFGSGANFGVKSFDPQWRNKRQYGGGALLDWGVHLIDQLLQLNLGRMDSIHSSVQTLNWNQGEVDDYVHALMRLDNGILYHMEINFASNATVPFWVIGGDQGTLQVMNDKEAVLLAKGAQPRPFTLEQNKLTAAKEIYESFIQHIQGGGPLSVNMDEVTAVMEVIDRIHSGAPEYASAT